MLQWNPVNMATISPKKIGRINEGFSTRIMYGDFCQAAKKNSGRITARWPKGGGFYCNNKFPNKISAL